MEKEITRLERQKKNQHRINVFLNDEYGFAVHEDIIVKYRLKKGKMISEQDLEELLLADEVKRAEYYGIRYLGIRPRTEMELIKHLHEKGFVDETIHQVCETFREKKYLDDHQFAHQWVMERMHLKPRGRNLLRFELNRKGVDSNIIDDALDEISFIEELEAAKKILLKKYPRPLFSNGMEMRNKIGPFLQRKGFSYEVISSVLEQLKESLIQSEDLY
ncbi:MAG TPA: RecX family transcriptional regulator [Paenibacillaceae bacterium]|nr:RecX family transcriptional regulator [Paenibacillaceae bacterium]